MLRLVSSFYCITDIYLALKRCRSLSFYCVLLSLPMCVYVYVCMYWNQRLRTGCNLIRAKPWFTLACACGMNTGHLAARKAASDVKLNPTDMNKSLNLILDSDDTRMPLFLSFSLTFIFCSVVLSQAKFCLPVSLCNWPGVDSGPEGERRRSCCVLRTCFC